jgi:hypothetical protein
MDEKKEEKEIPKSKDGQIKTLVILVIVIALIWGIVSSIDLFIVSALESVFPSRGNVKYAIYQIIIYTLLLTLLIYLTDIDAVSVFEQSRSMSQI